MSPVPYDARIQESFTQLNSIVTRRNELLCELFRMIQSRHDLVSSFDGSEQERNLQLFLQRFDLRPDPEHGSIANLNVEELSLPSEAPPSSPFHSIVPTAAENKANTYNRTTRSKSRAIERTKSPSPTFEKSREDILRPPEDLETGESQSRTTPGPWPSQQSTIPPEDEDEDNDELDLIGSSAFSVEGERRPIRIDGVGVKLEGSTPAFSDKGEFDESEVGPKSPHSQSPNSPSTKSTPKEIEEETESRLSTPSLKDEELDGEPNQLSMGDVDMVDVSDQQTAPQDSTPMPRKDDVPLSEGLPEQSLTGESGDVRIGPAVMEVDEPSKESAQPVSIKQENTPSSPKPLKSIRIHIPMPPSIQEEIIIPAPITTIKSEAPYNLDVDVASVSEPEPLKQSISNVDSYGQFSPQYTIPPLNTLPADFVRKTKPTKRKREKDGKRDKDDALPMGLNRWGATVMANPVWKKVARANKCLSTREWGVAMDELRLIRTIERIEHLKDSGRWTFRQPKKQRGVGGLLKTHWDYLLDEMKWMRIDFREERRWKMALAYNLSTSVLEWHFAKTTEQRQETGICVKWRPSSFRDNKDDAVRSMDEDMTQQERSNAQMLGVNYGSEDEDEDEDEPEKNQQIATDSLDPSVVINDSLDHDIQPKSEEVDDQSAIALLRQINSDSDPVPENHARSGNVNIDNALKISSADPILGGSKSSSQSTNGDGDAPIASVKPSESDLAPCREQIIYSSDEQLFVEFDSMHIHDSANKQNTPKTELFESLDLPSLFPDLQPLGLLDIPVSSGPTDGKKKVEKRSSDRDDPNKRIEDTTYTKLYPTGKFMFSKPTLIGPLQAAKKWKDGKWLPMDNAYVALEPETSTKVSEENTSDLFDGRPGTSSQHALKDKGVRKDAELRHSWSPSDDALLKSLVDKYSYNWQLISECFNSARLSTPSDVRTSEDCQDRWKEKLNPERKSALAEASHAISEDATSTNPNQMTTRGVKRNANTSTSSPINNPSCPNTETRKRRRHVLLGEAIRKATKKRADAVQKALANQRKTPAVHETHNQFNKLPKLSPAELSRMKAERDQRDNQDAVLARKRQEEQMRQTLLMREQQRPGAPVQPQQPQPQPQQVPPQPQPQAQTQPPLQPAVQPPPQQQPQQQPQQNQQQQQQQTFPHQLAQLQQLQAQQQANQNQRQNVPVTSIQNRPTRPTANTNGRPVIQQAQLLQQGRAMQVPVQVGTPTNMGLLPQGQASGPAGGGFYGLPPNLTQEQLIMLALQASQQQQQQNQSAQNNFNAQS